MALNRRTTGPGTHLTATPENFFFVFLELLSPPESVRTAWVPCHFLDQLETGLLLYTTAHGLICVSLLPFVSFCLSFTRRSLSFIEKDDGIPVDVKCQVSVNSTEPVELG